MSIRCYTMFEDIFVGLMFVILLPFVALGMLVVMVVAYFDELFENVVRSLHFGANRN